MREFVTGMLAGALLAIMAVAVPVTHMAEVDKNDWWVKLTNDWGTPGHVCFANHTCRDAMKCVTGVGLEDGVCVK